MIRSFILILSAFTSLVATATLVNGALSPPSPTGVDLSMVGVLMVGGLCWLRWRWRWKNPLLGPSLIVGAALLACFAYLGVGQSVRVSSVASSDTAHRGILDVLFGAQAIVMSYGLWKDRREALAITRDQDQNKPDEV